MKAAATQGCKGRTKAHELPKELAEVAEPAPKRGPGRPRKQGGVQQQKQNPGRAQRQKQNPGRAQAASTAPKRGAPDSAVARRALPALTTAMSLTISNSALR